MGKAIESSVSMSVLVGEYGTQAGSPAAGADPQNGQPQNNGQMTGEYQRVLPNGVPDNGGEPGNGKTSEGKPDLSKDELPPIRRSEVLKRIRKIEPLTDPEGKQKKE